MSDDTTTDGGRPAAATVAVVGAGPAGFFLTDSLFRSGRELGIDLYERLPVPYGLVRYGVAPDHPDIRRISAKFERTAAQPGFRFFGNVEVGVDVSVAELREAYDAVVLCCGMPQPRRLGIPGEELSGCYGAADFVGWYTGHPDRVDLDPILDGSDAVVVGNGNVAIDVARMLASPREALAATDMPSPMVEAIAANPPGKVWVIGRRGPEQAAYTPKEHNELLAVAGGRVEFRYLLSPQRIDGDDRVRAVQCSHNRLVDNRAVPTETMETLHCGLIVQCIGYRGVPLPGVPYDERTGTCPNQDGRIDDGLYVAGWLEHGPVGLIGNTRKYAAATAVTVLAELRNRGRNPVRLVERLGRDGIRVVDFAGWQRIDAAERARGAGLGKEREKFLARADLLAAAQRSEAS